MKQFCLAVSLLFCVAAGHAQVSAKGNITAAGSTCATTNACIVIQLPNSTSAPTGGTGVGLSGTWSATVQFEKSVDGIIYVAALSTDASPVSSATSNIQPQFSTSGYNFFRVRCSAYSSGTVVVKIQTSPSAALHGGSGGGGGGVNTVSGDGALLTNSGSTGDVVLTVGSGATHQFWNGAWTQPAVADVTGAAPLASPTFTGTVNASGATHTLPAVKGLAASVPATCTVGEVYFATDATAGQNFYFCAATNTWTQQLNSGGGGGGNTTSTSLTTNKLPKANGANSIINSSISDDGTTVSTSENLSVGSAASTASIGLDTTGGNNSITTQASATGLTWTLPSTTGTFADSATAPIVLSATTGVLTCPACIVATVNPSAGVLHVAGSTQTATGGPVVGSDMTNGTVGATQLAAQYSKGSCTEAWAGSGTAFALTAGDDAASNNTCYNDSGVTRTITAVKCRNDNASNTTTVNPTFGSAGTGTTICSGALTCGNSYAYSSTCTVSNASWTTGTGVNPVQGGTPNGTSIAVIIEYTF